MESMFSLTELPPMDPCYGLSRERMTSVLTAENWSEKALIRIRQDGRGWLYVWLRAMPYEVEGQIVPGYGVCVLSRAGDGAEDGEEEDGEEFEDDFLALDDALAYVNGTDGGKVALETRLAQPEEFPEEQEPSTWLSTF